MGCGLEEVSCTLHCPFPSLAIDPAIDACVPPSLVMYLPMPDAAPVSAAPEVLSTSPNVNPVTASARMKLICVFCC